MIITIHQPNYFPYPGFFHKISLAEVFVVMDDVQFQYDHTNRNKIVSPNGGWTRITVPTKRQHKFYNIKDVEINNELPWRKKNWDSIYTAYVDTKFFYLYNDYLEKLYTLEWNYLFDINFEIIKKCIEWLGIKIEIIKESELNIKGEGTERLVNVCKKLQATTYVSGDGGKNYLNEKLFEKNHINLQYQNYKSIMYTQNLTKTFIPNLSILDALANIGSKNTLSLIKQ